VTGAVCLEGAVFLSFGFIDLKIGFSRHFVIHFKGLMPIYSAPGATHPRNPKSEIRNPKQVLNPKLEILNPRRVRLG
jgi:hypothetical protein